MNDETETNDPTEQLDDVAAALEAEGAVPDEQDTDDGEEADDGLPGPLGLIEGLSGTGKSLESYEGSPITEAVGPDGSKGSLHIARGVDGLSPLAAMNPIMDIGIGIVLIQLEKADSDGEESGTEVEGGGYADDPTDKDDDLL